MAADDYGAGSPSAIARNAASQIQSRYASAQPAPPSWMAQEAEALSHQTPAHMQAPPPDTAPPKQDTTASDALGKLAGQAAGTIGKEIAAGAGAVGGGIAAAGEAGGVEGGMAGGMLAVL